MTTFNEAWNAAFEGIPADSENANLGANRIRALKTDLRQRLAVDHSWNDGLAIGSNDGKHNKVTLRPQGGDPTLDAGDSAIYGKAISGVTELFFLSSAGTVLQITSGGAVMPPGVVMPYGGQTLPSAWFWCDGASYSRTVFSALFTAIGTSYGVGDGATTFNIPDLRGRAPWGRDNLGITGPAGRLTVAGSGIDGTQLGVGGGDQRLAAHSHGSGGGSTVFITDGASLAFVGGGGNTFGSSAQTAVSGSGASQNMPPMLTFNWIIKF